MCLGRSLPHASNVVLVLNLFSDYVSLQYYAVFDDNFTLILALRVKTVPANWADLVEKSLESASDVDIDLSKV